MKLLRCATVLAGIAILALTPTTATAQPTLTNAGTWRACSDGHAGYGTCGYEFWDSNPGGWSDNFWSNTGPAGSLAMLSTVPIQLSVGTNTLHFFQDYYSFNAYMGLDLVFDGSSTSQIGGWNTTSTSGVLAFNGVNTIFNAVGGPLSFASGGYQVTLTGFRFDALGDDRVGAFAVGPDAQSDWRGTVTLEVEEMAAPEPASLVLFATGLIGVAVAARRRMA